jgi:hypothetical protein
MTGIPLDVVNTTLQRLLRKRRLAMTARDRWQRCDRLGCDPREGDGFSRPPETIRA